MAKILLSGGAGFIGSTLSDRLIELGHQVVVVDDLSSGKKEYLNPQAIFYQVDICDHQALREIFVKEKPEYVYHLAAQIDVRKSVKDMVFDNQVNILGSINILQNSHEHQVKKIFFASSGGAAYGFPENIPTTEDAPTYPVSPYGINKLGFEKYLNYFYKVFGQKYLSFRLANVYGPRQYKGGEAGVVAIFSNNAVEGKTSYIFGDGLQTRDFVYVDDVVNAFIAGLDSDFVGEVNISTQEEVNLLEIVEAISEALGEEVKIEHQPAKLGEERRVCLDNSKAKNILNWEPQVSLKEGIARTIAWTKKQKA